MNNKEQNIPKNMSKNIDWNEVHRRMKITSEAIEYGVILSPDKKKAILKSRAITLAQKLDEEQPDATHIEILEFLLGDEVFGAETQFIREVYPLKEVVHIPGTPLFVRGITNVRGEIFSVIDLKIFFGLSAIELTDDNRVIIAKNNEMEFGILASSVSGVRSINAEVIQMSLPMLTGTGAEYFKGVTNERTLILNLEKILSTEKLIVSEDVEMISG